MNAITRLVILALITYTSLQARSIHRPTDKNMPQITVYWKDDPTQKHVLRESHLEEYPYFKIFNKEYFNKNLLPNTPISFRNQKNKTVEPAVLQSLVEKVVQEVLQSKKWYTSFDIIKNADFNVTEQCGVLVLKFKHYPFILKLFFENPKSMVTPFNKGIEPCFFFFMGGGINRHLTGFTRVRNRELVEQKIKDSTYWKDYIELPRKWFILPASNRFISIEGLNIGSKEKQYAEIPGIYGIITDEIIPERIFSLSNKEDKETALRLSKDFDMMIDANISNFRIEHGSHKLVIIDTEHFPSLVGIREEPKDFKSYFQWYCYLANKFVSDSMFQTKRSRRALQKSPNKYHLQYNDTMSEL